MVASWEGPLVVASWEGPLVVASWEGPLVVASWEGPLVVASRDGAFTNNEPSPVTVLRQSWVTNHGSPVSAWMSTLGPVHTLNGVVFTLDAAIRTESWEAITLPTRFLNMERVHPQRPASPPLFTGHTFLKLVKICSNCWNNNI